MGALVLLPAIGGAQTAISAAGGYRTYPLKEGFNVVGQSLFEGVLLTGTIDAVTGGVTIIDGSTDFQAALSDADRTYLLEILDGPQAGLVVEFSGDAIGADSLTIGSHGLAPGISYQIRPASTLEDFFGGMLEGGAAPGPKTDYVWMPRDDGGFDRYFYHEESEKFRSAAAPFVPLELPIFIYYPEGFFVELNSKPALPLIVVGMVKTSDTLVTIRPGYNLVASNAPVAQTFGASGLELFLQSTEMIPTMSTDIVWQPAPVAGGYLQYFFSSSAGQWRRLDSPFLGNEGLTELSATGGIFVQRRGPTVRGLIRVPSFYKFL